MLEQQILDTFLFSPQWIDPVDPHPAGVTHPWHSFALPPSLPSSPKLASRPRPAIFRHQSRDARCEDNRRAARERD